MNRSHIDLSVPRTSALLFLRFAMFIFSVCQIDERAEVCHRRLVNPCFTRLSVIAFARAELLEKTNHARATQARPESLQSVAATATVRPVMSKNSTL